MSNNKPPTQPSVTASHPTPPHNYSWRPMKMQTQQVPQSTTNNPTPFQTVILIRNTSRFLVNHGLRPPWCDITHDQIQFPNIQYLRHSHSQTTNSFYRIVETRSQYWHLREFKINHRDFYRLFWKAKWYRFRWFRLKHSVTLWINKTIHNNTITSVIQMQLMRHHPVVTPISILSLNISISSIRTSNRRTSNNKND